MQFLYDLATGVYSLDDLIRWGGYIGLVVIVFTLLGRYLTDAGVAAAVAADVAAGGECEGELQLLLVLD